MKFTKKPFFNSLVLALFAFPLIILFTNAATVEQLNTQINTHAKIERIVINLNSVSGDDVNNGSLNYPIRTLEEAQYRIDKYIKNLALESSSEHRQTTFQVEIYAAGMFDGELFVWNHPHKNVHLKIANAPGHVAVFTPYSHECYNKQCRANPVSLRPQVCKIDETDCRDGVTFFTAPGQKTQFKRGKGYTGYGTIVIEGLTIKGYKDGIGIFSHKDSKPTSVVIKNNIFENNGQVGNINNWSPAYASIMLSEVNSGLIENNKFIDSGNKRGKDNMPGWFHGIYVKNNSDHNIIRNNVFKNISGEPIKFRNGSDHNKVLNNRFVYGPLSVKIFPVQNWYEGWYRDDSLFSDVSDRELPSMAITLKGNSFENGYVNSPIATPESSLQEQLCADRAIAVPNTLPQSYINHAIENKTYARFVIEEQKIFHTHVAPYRCNTALRLKIESDKTSN